MHLRFFVIASLREAISPWNMCMLRPVGVTGFFLGYRYCVDVAQTECGARYDIIEPSYKRSSVLFAVNPNIGLTVFT